MATKKVDITVDERLFRQMLLTEQRNYTEAAVQRSFQAWKAAHAADIHKAVTAYLDKEMPDMIAKQLPKLVKGFYCGFDG